MCECVLKKKPIINKTTDRAKKKARAKQKKNDKGKKLLNGKQSERVFLYLREE